MSFAPIMGFPLAKQQTALLEYFKTEPWKVQLVTWVEHLQDEEF